MSEEAELHRATRRLLFEEKDSEIPGKGMSAASTPSRHVRVKVTMNLDGDIVAYFKERAKVEGRSYQLLINEALREYAEGTRPERLAQVVGKILLSDPSFLTQVTKALKEK